MKIFLNGPKQRYTRSTGVAKLSIDQTGTTRKHKTVLETEAEMEGKKNLENEQQSHSYTKQTGHIGC